MSIFNFKSILNECQQQGFVIVELMFGSVIVISVSLLLADWHNTLLVSRENCFKHIEAVALAQSVLEIIRSTGKIKHSYDNNLYKISSVAISDEKLAHFFRVTITVKWQQRAQIKSISLSTGVLLL
jgi:hypothetical protein